MSFYQIFGVIYPFIYWITMKVRPWVKWILLSSMPEIKKGARGGRNLVINVKCQQIHRTGNYVLLLFSFTRLHMIWRREEVREWDTSYSCRLVVKPRKLGENSWTPILYRPPNLLDTNINAFIDQMAES